MGEFVEFVEFCATAEEISKASAAKPRQEYAIVTEDLGKYYQGHKNATPLTVQVPRRARDEDIEIDIGISFIVKIAIV